MIRPFAAALLAAAGAASAQVELYAVNFAGNLYRLSPTTGAATLVGPTGFTRLTSATADPAGMIYTARARDPAVPTDSNQLIRVDTATGAGTLIADYGTANELRALAFGTGNVLYAIRDNNPADDLLTVDPVTGAVTLVGPTGRSDIEGLTGIGTGAGGLLYAVGDTATGVLYRLNAATGAATVIYSDIGAGGDVQSIEWSSGAAFWIAGANLRGVHLNNGSAGLIGPTGLNDIRGLAAPCYANCDRSTAVPYLNVADFTCFLQRFAANDPYANCDSSTTPPAFNVADFTCFLQKFAAGCP